MDPRKVISGLALEGRHPLLLVQSSDGAEVMALKNGLTVADLLRPFAQIVKASIPMRNATRSYTISEFTARVLPSTELGCPPVDYTEGLLSTAVSQANPAGRGLLLERPNTIADAVGLITSQTQLHNPWMTAFRSELGQQALRCLPFEAFDAPVAVLVVLSTLDPNLLTLAHELASASSFPPPLSQQDQFDPDIPRYFLLLHDAGAAAMGGFKMVRQGPADTAVAPESLPLSDPSAALRELRNCFPPACCYLLPINSLGTASTLAVTQADLWESSMQAPLFAPTVARALGAGMRGLVPGLEAGSAPLATGAAGGVGGASSAAQSTAPASASVQSLAFAPSPGPQRTFAQMLLTRAVVPVRGCCLSGDDILALRTTMGKLLAEQLIPSLEARMYSLNAAAASAKKGLRDTLRSWLGSGAAGGAGSGGGGGAAASATISARSGGALRSVFPVVFPASVALVHAHAAASSAASGASAALSAAGTPSAAAAASAAEASGSLARGADGSTGAPFSAPSGAAGACDVALVTFPHASLESQLRLLADLSLMLGDIEQASAVYKRLRDELAGRPERSPCFYAAACEMVGLCAALQAAAASLATGIPLTAATPGIREADAALETAVGWYFRAAQAAGTAPLVLPPSPHAQGDWKPQPLPARRLAVRVAVRAVMWAGDVLALAAQPTVGAPAAAAAVGALAPATARCRDAAALLRRAGTAEGEGSLLCALLTEQAAAHYLRTQPAPSWRKGAHHLAMAGHQFALCAQPKLAVRCLSLAMAAYAAIPPEGPVLLAAPGGAGRGGWSSVYDNLLLSLSQRLLEAGEPAAACNLLQSALAGKGWLGQPDAAKASAPTAPDASMAQLIPLQAVHLPLSVTAPLPASAAGAAYPAAPVPVCYGFVAPALQLRLPPQLHRFVLRELLRCFMASAGAPPLQSSSLPRVVTSSLTVASSSNYAAACLALRCVASWSAAQAAKAAEASRALARTLQAEARLDLSPSGSTPEPAAAGGALLSLPALSDACGIGSALIELTTPPSTAASGAAASVPLPLPLPLVPGEGLWAGATAHEGPPPTAGLLGSGWGLYGTPSAAALEPLAAAVQALANVRGRPLSRSLAASVQRELQRCVNSACAASTDSATPPGTLPSLVSGGASSTSGDAATLLVGLLSNVACSEGGGPFPATARCHIGSYVPAHRQAAWAALEGLPTAFALALERLAAAAAGRAVVVGGENGAEADAGAAAVLSPLGTQVLTPQGSEAAEALARVVRRWALGLLQVDGEGKWPHSGDARQQAAAAAVGAAIAMPAPLPVEAAAALFPFSWRDLCRARACEQEDEGEERARRHGAMPALHTRLHPHHEPHSQPSSAPRSQQVELTPFVPTPGPTSGAASAAGSGASVVGGPGPGAAESSPYAALAAAMASVGAFDGLSPSSRGWDADGDVDDTGQAAYRAVPTQGAAPSAGATARLATATPPLPLLAPLPVLGCHFHDPKGAVPLSRPARRRAGDPVFLSLLLHNPLAVELPLLGLHAAAVWSAPASGGAAECAAVQPPCEALRWLQLAADSSPLPRAAGAASGSAPCAVLPVDVLLLPGESRLVHLPLCPLMPGRLRVRCLRWRMAGLAPCEAPLSLPGPPATEPRQQRTGGVRSADSRCEWEVEAAGQRASVTLTWEDGARGTRPGSGVVEALEGEVVRGLLRVRNESASEAIDTLMLSAEGKGRLFFLPLQSPGGEAQPVPAPSLGMEGSTWLLAAPGQGSASIPPGGFAEWPVALRAEGPGERTLRLSLCYGETAAAIAATGAAAGADTAAVAAPAPAGPSSTTVGAMRKAAAAAAAAATAAVVRRLQHPLLSPRLLSARLRAVRWVCKVRVRPALAASATVAPSATAAGEWNLQVRLAHAMPALASEEASDGAAASAAAPSLAAPLPIEITGLCVISDHWAASVEATDTWRPPAPAGAAASLAPVTEAGGAAASRLGAPLCFREVRSLRVRLVPRSAPHTAFVDACSEEGAEGGEHGGGESSPARAPSPAAALSALPVGGDGGGSEGGTTDAVTPGQLCSGTQLTPVQLGLLRQQRAWCKVQACVREERIRERGARQAAAAAEALPPSLRAIAERAEGAEGADAAPPSRQLLPPHESALPCSLEALRGGARHLHLVVSWRVAGTSALASAGTVEGHCFLLGLGTGIQPSFACSAVPAPCLGLPAPVFPTFAPVDTGLLRSECRNFVEPAVTAASGSAESGQVKLLVSVHAPAAAQAASVHATEVLQPVPVAVVVANASSSQHAAVRIRFGALLPPLPGTPAAAQQQQRDDSALSRQTAGPGAGPAPAAVWCGESVVDAGVLAPGARVVVSNALMPTADAPTVISLSQAVAVEGRSGRARTVCAPRANVFLRLRAAAPALESATSPDTVAAASEPSPENLATAESERRLDLAAAGYGGAMLSSVVVDPEEAASEREADGLLAANDGGAFDSIDEGVLGPTDETPAALSSLDVESSSPGCSDDELQEALQAEAAAMQVLTAIDTEAAPGEVVVPLDAGPSVPATPPNGDAV